MDKRPPTEEAARQRIAPRDNRNGRPSSDADSRATHLLQAVETAVLHEPRENGLLARVCRALTDLGGYALATVSFADDTPEKAVSPEAVSGSPVDFVLKAEICWGEGPRGGDPTGVALRTGKTAVNRDFENNPQVAPWRAAAAAAGFRSSIAIPLILQAAARPMALTVYSVESGRFDRREVRLLEQLAEITAYGVDAIRTRISEEQARAESRSRAELLEAVQDTVPLGLLLVGSNDEILSCNRQYLALWKIPRSRTVVENVGQLEAFLASRTLDADGFRARTEDAFASREGPPDHDTYTLKDGRILDRITAPVILKDGSYAGRVVCVRDVTGQKTLELGLRRTNRILALLAGALLLICLILVLRSSLGHANLFSADGQSPLRNTDGLQHPYSAIALVQPPNPVPMDASGHKGFVRGTGFMVSPCYALTDYHVVFGVGRKAPDPNGPHPVLISLGSRWLGFLHDRIPATAVKWGDFVHDRAQDWALLAVPSCPGRDERIGWLDLASGPAFNPYRGAAAVAGYDGAFPLNVMVGQTGCYFGRPLTPTVIRHYCASRPGMSGAPIFIQGPSGPEVVAMATREIGATSQVLLTNDPDHSNLATYIPQILATSDVGRIISADVTAKASGGA